MGRNWIHWLYGEGLRNSSLWDRTTRRCLWFFVESYPHAAYSHRQVPNMSPINLSNTACPPPMIPWELLPTPRNSHISPNLFQWLYLISGWPRPALRSYLMSLKNSQIQNEQQLDSGMPVPLDKYPHIGQCWKPASDCSIASPRCL